MGTLRIKGTIELNQFWPTGSSDADTTKMKLIVGEDSFQFKATGENDFKKTTVFHSAISKGQGVKPVINTSKRSGEQSIIIRLQGVDAPELHYKAAPLKKNPVITDAKRKKYNEINKERRQHFAESATVALATHLKYYTTTEFVEAIFESEIDYPFEVVDTYGRFIGNIYVGNANDNDLNKWLVENGWCTPAFYTSMAKEEIAIFLAAWIIGKKIAGRTSKSIIRNASKFDWDLLYRAPGTVEKFTIKEDKGKAIMPKIFRRQVAWMVAKKAGIITAGTSFKAHLQKTPDQLVLLNDFLANGITASRVYALHDFMTAEGTMLKKPEEIVFQEKPATLVGPDGKKIIEW
jgi:endonuclease YncB( thermonuclease family)